MDYENTEGEVWIWNDCPFSLGNGYWIANGPTKYVSQP